VGRGKVNDPSAIFVYMTWPSDSLSTVPATNHQILEDPNPQQHCCENSISDDKEVQLFL
jgi:hypothetical protein